jgi:hypothetical protein
MDDGNLAVLVDAKTEYTKQLVNILKTNMYHIFLDIFNQCYKECLENKTPNKVFVEFQQKMREIPKWNNDIIDGHCETIMAKSKCDWLDDLITAVFVAHTRILTSINVNRSRGKIDLNIPKTNHFIHKCFIDVARYFWKNSYLFDETVGKFEYQKNRRDAEILIETSINETIRKELPVKNILKKYLGNDYEEEEESVDEEKPMKNLRKMVMKELENCSGEKLNKLKLILEGGAAEPPVPLAESVVEPAVAPVAEPLINTEPVVVSEPVTEPEVVAPVTEPEVVAPVTEPEVVAPVTEAVVAQEIIELDTPSKPITPEDKKGPIVVNMVEEAPAPAPVPETREPELAINLDKQTIEELPEELKEDFTPSENVVVTTQVPDISFNLDDLSSDLKIEELDFDNLDSIQEQPKKLTRNYSFFD